MNEVDMVDEHAGPSASTSSTRSTSSILSIKGFHMTLASNKGLNRYSSQSSGVWPLRGQTPEVWRIGFDINRGVPAEWVMRVALEKLDVIGNELAIRWSDQSETFIPLETLRRHCPCAECAGEKDLMGKVYKPETAPLGPASFQLKRCDLVGGYAILPEWSDGHRSGIYSFEYLQSFNLRADEEISGNKSSQVNLSKP